MSEVSGSALTGVGVESATMVPTSTVDRDPHLPVQGVGALGGSLLTPRACPPATAAPALGTSSQTWKWRTAGG